MGKIKFSGIIKKNLSPFRLWKIYILQKNRKKNQRVYNDAQLKLYAQMLPQGFLHYGYFEDINIKPEDISLNDIEQAQLLYAQNIINLISDKSQPVLDVGCGMGGLLKLLLKENISTVALTPDINQAKYVSDNYKCNIVQSKFEDIEAEKYNDYFGTVITSESLQYLDLNISLKLINKILKQSGKWIACDYFRIGEAHEKSGHNWNTFLALLKANNLKVTFEKDITLNILPTINYVYMWANRVGLPLKDFIIEKIETKNPGIFFAIQDLIPQINNSIQNNIDTINPAIFARQKQYKLLMIEKC